MSKTKQLEAPVLPAAPMTATTKQRRDLEYVKNALRASQPRGEGDEEAEDEELESDDETLLTDAGQLGARTEPEPTSPAGGTKEPGKQDPYAANGFGAPDWFKLPPGGLPADIAPGSILGFMRFPVWITNNPQKGERQCALRALSPVLEKFGRNAAKGSASGYETVASLAKMMICVVDGSLPELFKAGPGSVNHFWAEIGPKARDAVVTYYVRTHQFTEKERDAFLASCLTVRTVG
jgi:hypothetical protein